MFLLFMKPNLFLYLSITYSILFLVNKKTMETQVSWPKKARKLRPHWHYLHKPLRLRIV